MPNTPSKRRTKLTPRTTELTQGVLAKLYRIEPYHRNEISPAQIDRLRDLIDRIGFPEAAAEIGIHKSTLLTVCAGFGHKLMPGTAEVIRKYLRGLRG